MYTKVLLNPNFFGVTKMLVDLAGHYAKFLLKNRFFSTVTGFVTDWASQVLPSQQTGLVS